MTETTVVAPPPLALVAVSPACRKRASTAGSNCAAAPAIFFAATGTRAILRLACPTGCAVGWFRPMSSVGPIFLFAEAFARPLSYSTRSRTCSSSSRRFHARWLFTSASSRQFEGADPICFGGQLCPCFLVPRGLIYGIGTTRRHPTVIVCRSHIWSTVGL